MFSTVLFGSGQMSFWSTINIYKSFWVKRGYPTISEEMNQGSLYLSPAPQNPGFFNLVLSKYIVWSFPATVAILFDISWELLSTKSGKQWVKKDCTRPSQIMTLKNHGRILCWLSRQAAVTNILYWGTIGSFIIMIMEEEYYTFCTFL